VTFSYRDGVAHFDVRPQGRRGPRRRLTIEAPTRDEAVARYEAFQRSLLLAPPPTSVAVAGTTPLLRDYLDEYWKRQALRVSKKTAAADEPRLERIKSASIGSLRLHEVNQATVRDFAAALKASGRAPATINNYLSLLRKVLRDAHEREILPAMKISRWPREVEQPLELELTPAERKRLIWGTGPDARDRFFELAGQESGWGPKGLAGYWDRYLAWCRFLRIALETGITLDDLRTLTWASIGPHEIRLRRSKTNVEAVIPITALCREALEACRAAALHPRLVCVTPDGEPWSQITIRRYWAMAKRLAKIGRRLRFHDLRHSLGCRLAEAGCSDADIAKVLGHASTRATARYRRVGPQSTKRVAEALARTA